MRKRVSDLLKLRYGLTVLDLAEVPAGWSAAALRARTDRGDFFVKVYDRNRPSTRIWIDRLDTWLPVAQWLGENTPLAAHMSVPVRAEDGAIRVEHCDLVLLVYPFIHGETLCERQLTKEQAHELGRVVGMLHEADVPLPLERLTEMYEFPFVASLRARLSEEALRALVAPCAPLIGDKIDELTARAVWLRDADPKKVLCNADIHGWNLMKTDHLILVDWEGLLFAPPEADLFSFTDTFFFGYAWDEVMSGYRAAHPNFVLNEDVLKTYRLRRRLEDIAAFIEGICADDLAPDARARTAALLARECGLLHST